MPALVRVVALKNRFASYWNNSEKPLPRSLAANSLSPEEMVFLATHARGRVIKRIARGDQNNEWVCAIAAGFASLLEHCDMEDWAVIYQGHSEWHEAVRPPSVIAAELAYFLGQLSIANPHVYGQCLRRGSIQGFIRLVDIASQYMRDGAAAQLESAGESVS